MGEGDRDMVKQVQKSNQILFQCEECGLYYADRETAEQCQAWCAKYKSCNLEIIKHAVEVKHDPAA